MAVTWDPKTFAVDPETISRMTPGFVKRDEIAWIGTHRHSPAGNQPYVMSYLFLISIDLPPGAKHITLPRDRRIRILAMTTTQGLPRVQAALPLYSADLGEPARPPAGGQAGPVRRRR